MPGSPSVWPPSSYHNVDGAFLEVLRSPWYSLIADLQDVVLAATVEYSRSRGLKGLYLPLTTRTVTCPSGLGSDSAPVAVKVAGVETFLPDSMQFMLEYAVRLAPGGSYNIMPSFRSDKPDQTHLSQFTHSEAEIPGGLDELIDHIEGYVKFLAESALATCGPRLANAVGDISHLAHAAETTRSFERLTFDEAARFLDSEEGCVTGNHGSRNLTRKGERELMRRVGKFVWVTHFDHLAVPFYHAFDYSDGCKAINADLFFGMGEVFGSGERHTTGSEVREGLAQHGVPEADYSWYVRMKDELPMRTAGFGMGVERFLMWVLHHEDIRDIPLVSRVDEPPTWPARVDRP